MKFNDAQKATILLFSAALMWGSSFVGSKICLNAGMLPFETVFYRMLLGSFFLAVIFRKELRYFSREALIGGVLLGLVTSLTYTVEMFGISMVETTKASFLTSTNIVMMPFLCALFLKTPLSSRSFLAAFITICGVAVMNLTGSETFSIARGDSLLLLAGFLYAIGSIVAAKFGRNVSPVQMTFLQLSVTMIYTGIMMLFEGRCGTYPPQAVGSIFYLAIGPTFICFLIKNYALHHLAPLRCTLILSTEGVFCALLSLAILHDHLTVKLVLGILLIFAGISIENFGSVLKQRPKGMA